MSGEKRAMPRVPVKWKARVLLPDRSLFEIPIRNVSLGDVGIVFPYVLKAEYPVNIEFFMPYDGEQRRVRAKTKVAFNAALADGTAQLGLRFTMVSDADKAALAQVITKLQRGKQKE